MTLYDAHNHLQDAWLASHRDRVFADLTAVGIARAVVNGTCETDWPDVAALAKFSPIVHPSYGLHPWDAGNRTPDWQQKLLTRLDADPHAAVGEIGLDRWILDRARPDDPRLSGLRRAPLAEQTEVFAWQFSLAAERNLPASIHCLDAFGLLLDALRTMPRPARGFLLHAYSGSAELAKEFAALGAYFSFNGSFLSPGPLNPLSPSPTAIPNFPALGDAKGQPVSRSLVDLSPRHLRRLEFFRQIPADRLLVETDAPAMRLPARLERFSLPTTADGFVPNHPANLVAAYAGLAELRGVTLESLATQVRENFLRLFGN